MRRFFLGFFLVLFGADSVVAQIPASPETSSPGLISRLARWMSDNNVLNPGRISLGGQILASGGQPTAAFGTMTIETQLYRSAWNDMVESGPSRCAPGYFVAQDREHHAVCVRPDAYANELECVAEGGVVPFHDAYGLCLTAPAGESADPDSHGNCPVLMVGGTRRQTVLRRHRFRSSNPQPDRCFLPTVRRSCPFYYGDRRAVPNQYFFGRLDSTADRAPACLDPFHDGAAPRSELETRVLPVRVTLRLPWLALPGAGAGLGDLSTRQLSGPELASLRVGSVGFLFRAMGFEASPPALVIQNYFIPGLNDRVATLAVDFGTFRMDRVLGGRQDLQGVTISFEGQLSLGISYILASSYSSLEGAGGSGGFHLPIEAGLRLRTGRGTPYLSLGAAFTYDQSGLGSNNLLVRYGTTGDVTLQIARSFGITVSGGAIQYSLHQQVPNPPQPGMETTYRELPSVSPLVNQAGVDLHFHW